MNDHANSPAPEASQPPTHPMTWSPDQERLVQILDREIDLIQTAERRPGWTQWAILAALGALVWLLLDQLDSSALTLESVPHVFLSLSLLLEGLGSMYGAVSHGQTKLSKRLRLQWTSNFGEDRPFLIFELLRTAALAHISLTLSANVGLMPFLVALAYFGLGSLTMFLMVVLSFLQMPVPSRPQMGVRNGIARLVYFFAGLLLLWSAQKYFLAVLAINTVGIADFRVSALLIALVFLIQKVLSGTKTSPLLESLIDIRRALVWGDLDLATAIRRADIAIAGLRISDVFQENLSRVLELFEQHDQELKEIIRIYEAIESSLPEDPSDYSRADSIKLTKLFDSSDDHYERGTKIQSQLKRSLFWLHTKADLVRRYSVEAPDEVAAIISKVASAADSLKATAHDLRTKGEQVRARVHVCLAASIREREELMRQMSELQEVIDNEADYTREEVKAAQERIKGLPEALERFSAKWSDVDESK